LKRIGPALRDEAQDLWPPPFRFPESKTAKRGDRLEAVSGREACGAGPLLSASFLFKESEPAEARALFRKQSDRPCRLRRKPSALRHFFFPRVAQKQSNRLITDRPRSVTAREDHFFNGGLIPEAGSRGANACGPVMGLRGGTSALRHVLLKGRR
jgi:hypothetical protein